MKKLRLGKWIATVIIGLFSLLFISPLVWMLSAAAKYEVDVMKFPIEWIPAQWNMIENFKTVWLGHVPFGLYYMNSLKLAILMTLLTLLFSSMAGYSFAKLNFPFKNALFVLVLSFFLIPQESTLVPRYILVKWFGLYDTHSALVLMGAFSIPLTFLARQFIRDIHTEYIEAAKIDGAGHLRIYWQIVLPMAKPILATVGILKFLWTWNDYQNPLIFLISKSKYTVTLGIQSFASQYGTSYAVIMMAAVSTILPILIVFVLLQKQVIKGITVGGVKG
ncbi:carbohydrate ABC transporter permease [Paenibacillus sp. CECT 9249]|uniref:carbohydrate ABC transporter permease n=1 Tax=unclassified Paenibacillus TaxID=185978 RepID=UPI001E544D26|nr:carbohydrate ABC transporter permease [Paenibacillus sp. CECT 9249]CAH0118959.1 L-arabinose transport system permease protein AraQ [Paenibacillus sp. CECT 9249]